MYHTLCAVVLPCISLDKCIMHFLCVKNQFYYKQKTFLLLISSLFSYTILLHTLYYNYIAHFIDKKKKNNTCSRCLFVWTNIKLQIQDEEGGGREVCIMFQPSIHVKHKPTGNQIEIVYFSNKVKYIHCSMIFFQIISHSQFTGPFGTM